MSRATTQPDPEQREARRWPLRDLADGFARFDAPSIGDAVITRVTDDSRKVIPGALFIAKQGPTRDGAAYIADALRAGAAAVLAQPGVTIPEGVVTLRAADPALALAHLAHRFHGSPSEALRVIGVTGTNGKTTVSTLARGLVEAAGSRCGLISTCEIDTGAGPTKALQTTPGAAELAERLADMVRHGCAAAAIETSSHALQQKRVAALRYRAAVFTNLTGDHLDYHRSMEDYAAAKAMLFESLGDDAHAIVNADDPWAERMVRDCRARVIRCSAADGDAVVTHLGHTERGALLRLRGPFGAFEVDLPLVGEHNAMNALQAACAAWAIGADADSIRRGLSAAHAPAGRLEPVSRTPGVREPFLVLVDYAHTDDALERSLQAVRPLVRDGGALRVVFGCGGDRDTTKRPRMGRVASTLADEVIITSDNPRTEDPDSIVEQVRAGASGNASIETVVQRDAAIRRAVEVARRGDVILIAGKGHEDYQILPDGKGGMVTRRFDDREVARDALFERFGETPAVEPKHIEGARAEGGVS
ncbi:MAG: UDP-N-acetylmuramoyl-L-alanyl-D-glutamate--2,6-diaminopimelate ligase [Phycisphaerales bacterium]